MFKLATFIAFAFIQCINSNAKPLFTKFISFEISNDSIKTQVESFVCPVEEKPYHPAGEDSVYKFITHNVTYPKEAKKSGIEGKVIISFVVEKNGNLSSYKVLKSLNPFCDKEAQRVVKLMYRKMGKWIPGKNGGRIVRSHVLVPIIFKLK